MKTYAWNEEKNQQLKTERSVSFEQVLVHIAAGDLLDIVEHPHPEKYKGQRIFIVKMSDSVHHRFVTLSGAKSLVHARREILRRKNRSSE